MKLRITISKYHSWYLCQISLQIMVLPIEIWKPLNFSRSVFAIWVKGKALIRTICSREIFRKKCRQQQNFDSDPKEAWHYNHVTFTPIAKNFMLYCRLIYMLSMLYVRLTIKVKVGIPESFKVGWYPHKITGSSHLNLHN